MNLKKRKPSKLSRLNDKRNALQRLLLNVKKKLALKLNDSNKKKKN